MKNIAFSEKQDYIFNAKPKISGQYVNLRYVARFLGDEIGKN